MAAADTCDVRAPLSAPAGGPPNAVPSGAGNYRADPHAEGDIHPKTVTLTPRR
ncbi:hypothetical protein Skr01_09630 [Sphaerisporangium krabiense]|uniref:Uncharacterized protein n=1 Tax=Sphaerisporangium krabiense TaxID=763782 RepID=A0A7W8ZCM9_9ACTN|nr:hypothetical protein [Sphaerisporangium krabiense]MBB5631460.1 hypothetical protein [Sphaerisporangium krabiense]GII60878.1 hypothetical protein Skr01_09630 [Sphaerisporangium krabiense]